MTDAYKLSARTRKFPHTPHAPKSTRHYVETGKIYQPRLNRQQSRGSRQSSTHNSVSATATVPAYTNLFSTPAVRAAPQIMEEQDRYSTKETYYQSMYPERQKIAQKLVDCIKDLASEFDERTVGGSFGYVYDFLF